MGSCRSIASLRIHRAGGLVILLAGCTGPAAPVPSTAPAAATVSFAALHQGPPLTDEEVQDFAERLTDAVYAGDNPDLAGIIDWDSLFARATANLEVADTFRDSFIDGARESIRNQGGFATQIAQSISGGGSYKFVRVRQVDGGSRALFRLLMPGGGGVNYHEMPLARRGEGQVMAVDIYIYLTGEFMSDTIRRAYVPVAADSSKGLLDRLAGKEQEFVKHFPVIERMLADFRAGRHQEALKSYFQLPESLQRDKTFLIVRLQAAQAQGEQEYAAAIADLERFHPDDPCVDMVSIDGHLMKKQYPLALRSIGRLEKAVGGDPYLDVMRANIHFERDDLPAARQAADRAALAEPTLEDAHWALLTILLKQAEFDAAIPVMSRLEDDFQADFTQAEGEPMYQELVKSPQYQTWRDGRKRK